MSTSTQNTIAEPTYWTKERKNEAIREHHQDMKPHGWTKTDAKRDITNMMKDNNIKIKN
jgi:hypothetical protein